MDKLFVTTLSVVEEPVGFSSEAAFLKADLLMVSAGSPRGHMLAKDMSLICVWVFDKV